MVDVDFVLRPTSCEAGDGAFGGFSAYRLSYFDDRQGTNMDLQDASDDDIRFKNQALMQTTDLAPDQPVRLRKRFFHKIGNFFKNVGNKIKDGVKKVGSGIVKAAKTVGKGVAHAAKTVGKGVVKAAKKTWGFVKKHAPTIVKVAGQIGGIALRIGGGIAGKVVNAFVPGLGTGISIAASLGARALTTFTDNAFKGGSAIRQAFRENFDAKGVLTEVALGAAASFGKPNFGAVKGALSSIKGAFVGAKSGMASGIKGERFHFFNRNVHDLGLATAAKAKLKSGLQAGVKFVKKATSSWKGAWKAGKKAYKAYNKAQEMKETAQEWRRKLTQPTDYRPQWSQSWGHVGSHVGDHAREYAKQQGKKYIKKQGKKMIKKYGKKAFGKTGSKVAKGMWKSLFKRDLVSIPRLQTLQI